MEYTNHIPVGSPIVVRTRTSGCFVARIVGGDGRGLTVKDWRHLRRWVGVGGEGTLYDLVASGKPATQTGPFFEMEHCLKDADAFRLTEDQYTVLING